MAEQPPHFPGCVVMVNNKFYAMAGFHQKTLPTANCTFASLFFQKAIVIRKRNTIIPLQISTGMCRISTLLRAIKM